jgi:hypothetical protein
LILNGTDIADYIWKHDLGNIFTLYFSLRNPDEMITEGEKAVGEKTDA